MRHRCGRAALATTITMMLLAGCGSGASFADPSTTTVRPKPTTTEPPPAAGPLVIDKDFDMCRSFSLDQIRATTSLQVTTSLRIDKNGLGCTWSVRPVATGETLELVRVAVIKNRPTVVRFTESSASYEVVPDLGDRTVVIVTNEPVESPFYKMVVGVTRDDIFMTVECVRLGQDTADPAVKQVYERQTLTNCNRPMAQLVLSRL